jgi:hypothetical protein
MSAVEHDRPSTTATERVRIRFLIEDSTLGTAEVLWAAPVNDGTFRLDNIPLLVFGVSLGDVVRVRQSNEVLEFEEVVARGGHSTYRVMINDPDDAAAQQHLRAIVTLGCGYEHLTPRFVAIDVPPAVDVFTVYELLDRGLDDGLWTFEEGHCGHPVDEAT